MLAQARGWGGNLDGVPVPRSAASLTLTSRFMPELRHCTCGKDYWFPGERWQHKDCASNTNASNRLGANHLSDVAVRNDAAASGGSVEARPKQRWPRESYNAYMREYMRKKRNLAWK